MSGLDNIASVFKSTHAAGRAALMPYFTLGFPDQRSSLEIIEAVANSGADLIELGIPFSDPLADGPTIQRSTQIALEQGTTVAGCLELTAELRSRGVRQPLILMGYVNPILSFGIEQFAAEASSAGADGLIVPDLPPEEAAEMQAACLEYGQALILMLAPTSTPARFTTVIERGAGFLYLVSLVGVTGARSELPTGLQEFVQRVRDLTAIPLAVGFGVSTPEQARAVGAFADGVIVGSALINAVEGAEDLPQAAASYVGDLRSALEISRDPGGR
jgi:tryptophan synthase alpha chain